MFAPVTEQGCTKRRVYLPAGRWQDVNSKEVLEGGRWLDCQAPLEKFIAFVKEGSSVAEVFA